MSSTNGTTKSASTYNAGSSVMGPGFEKFTPGHTVSVGSHKVEVVNYLAEGGFAQIYTVKFIELLNEFDTLSMEMDMKPDKNKLEIGSNACLKRVIVSDENGLNEMKNEIDVMIKLSGAPNIVQYYDSNATKLQNGTPAYEVFLLMELCPNKSLLDFMNDRLATKLSIDEIFNIMYDITLGLAQMHYLPEPLIHRDIKIENVLVDGNNNFKLADFGSTSGIKTISQTHQEIAISAQDIFVHTTPQYRSPEMIDLYRYLPIDEKADIWALGVFLYKLLFYITPFEMTGQFAILHAKFEFPDNKYPTQLIDLISAMLMENPNMRPNIYQVFVTICNYKKLEVPLHDKYEAGPFDYQACNEYRNKIKDIQYQLFLLEQNRLNDPGKRIQINPTYKSLFTNLFEIAPKIANIEKQNVSGIAIDKNRSDISRTKLSENDGESSSYSKSEGPSRVATNNSKRESLTSTNIEQNKINTEETYYPSMTEINGYLEKELPVVTPSPPMPELEYTSNNSQTNPNFTMLPNIATQSEKSVNSFYPPSRQHSVNVNSSIQRTSIINDPDYRSNANASAMDNIRNKPHKSNNPFPYINSEISVNRNANGVTNYFIDENNRDQPRQSAVNFNSPQYDNTKPTAYNGINPPPKLDEMFSLTSNANMANSNITKKTNTESRGKQLFPNTASANSNNLLVHNILEQPNVRDNNSNNIPFQFISQQSQEMNDRERLKMTVDQFTNSEKIQQEAIPDLIDLKSNISNNKIKEEEIHKDQYYVGRNLDNLKSDLHKPLDLTFNELNLSTESGLVDGKSKISGNGRVRNDEKIETEDERLSSNGSEISLTQNEIGRRSNLRLDANENDLLSQESIRDPRIDNIEDLIVDEQVSEHSSESIGINLEARKKQSLRKSAFNSTVNSASKRNSLMSNVSDVTPLRKFDDTRGASTMKAGRHSLDLKYEEINFTRRREQNADSSKHEIQQTNPHSSAYKNNNSSTSIESKPRTSLSRIRQSLDMERLRKDPQNSKSKGGKRSLFSMFK